MASLHSLPSDIILEIASYFSLSSEALQLGLTSSRIFEHIIPLLYSKVTLKGSAQCLQTLKMLGSHPQRARHVRSLRLQPNGSTVVVTPQSSRPRSNLPEVYEICAALRRAAFGMEVLQRFVWDADELPEDEIWFALRRFCPQLKYIGTSFGSILPSGNSHLFDFTNLRGFSAVFKEGFFLSFEGLISFDGIPREEAFPGYDRLWDMLIKRCPGLEELIIDGLSPTEPVDAHRLTRGRWPKLGKLVLGDIVVDWHTAINSHTKRSFITFLDAHPSITSLHLHSHQPSISAPPILESLQPHSLSKLREFAGSLDQLQALQHKADLHSLRVPDSILLRESTPLAISGMLSSVPNLTSLSISFTLLHGYDNGSIIRSIASACPLLDHLDFTCMGRASFKLETFCRAIKPLGRLKSLHLQIVKARGEENIAACGSQLVLTNPRLSTFKISFLALDSTFNERSNLPAVLQSASFHLTSDHHGLPVSLHITEHHQSLLKWRVAPRRIHDVDLRPVGFPGSQSESIWSLIMSPSPAGQEMRMLGLCIGLLTSAVIGSIVL